MNWIFLLCLSLITLCAYAPCLKGTSLRWDDTKHIIQNVHVYMPANLTSLKAIFTSFVNDTYIPLTTLSFHWQYHTLGIDPFVSHLINIIGAIGTVWLVYLFTLRLRLSPWAAMISSSVFALHPMHVESIAWATERKDILCGFFYLLTLIIYQEYLRSSKKYFFWLSIGSGLLSVLSKSMAVSLPWVLLLVDWSHHGALKKKDLLGKIPFALVILPIAALTFFKLGGHPTLSFPGSIFIFIWSIAFYIEKFIFPYPLLPLYAPAYPLTLNNPAYLISCVVVGLSLWAGWLCRKDRVLFFGVLFYVATIFFFFRVDFADINVVADRFIYIPSLGLCVILGTMLSRTHRAVPITICILLGAMTLNQARIWQNDRTLWTHVLTHQPYNKIAQTKYKSILWPAPKVKVDYQHFDQMLQRLPNKAQAYLRRSIDLVASGDYALAQNDLNAAILLDPNLEEAYINRGNLLQSRGDFNNALADYDHALRINPQSSALLNKAVLFGILHQKEKALSLFKTALSTNRDTERALFERGYFFATNGQCEQAIADFSAAIIHNKKYTESYYQRGLCATTTENLDLAASDFTMVTGLDPQNDQAYGQLCRVELKQKQTTAAIKDCSRAIELFSYEAQYYNDRAKAYFISVKNDKALADLDRVITLDPQNTQARIIRNQIGQFVNPK